MDEKIYRFLKWTAIIMAVTWIGWTIYDSYFSHRDPGDTAYLSAEYSFADGRYEEALNGFNQVLTQNADHFHALSGKARTLLRLERYTEALMAFNNVIMRDPHFAPNYANRGILHDHLGNYEEALADYRQALQLDPNLAKGPGWLTRFFRLQTEKPPTIASRADYLSIQLAKPAHERELKRPEEDAKQRPYQQ
jgi:tetratricopeptide (TPR) repeat protein